MTIRSAQQELFSALSGLYDAREASVIADWTMEHITGRKRVDRLMDKDAVLSDETIQQFKRITSELLNHRPIQYVLGEAWFLGRRFFVNEDVLIPRPETEELVEWIILTCKTQDKQVAMLDIGAGSGCIPVSIALSQPDIIITSIDISEKALAVAKRNATELQAAVDFKLVDFLDEGQRDLPGSYDIIVSNPPYIKQSERAQMAKHVLDHEPALALFVPDDDALLFYRKMAAFGRAHLNAGGFIFAEINEMLGDEVTALFAGYGYECELRKDMQGRERMVKAWR